MTALSSEPVYPQNALMNAHLFALGCALVIYGLFNAIFLGGFFRTAYKIGKPFVIYIIAGFIDIFIFEALHHVPGLGQLNAFGTESMGLQAGLLAAGAVIFAVLTILSYRASCNNFEKIDL